MKKNYTLSLDKEKVEELQKHLSKFGLTFSGVINNILDDINDNAEDISLIMDYSNLSFKKAKEEFNKNNFPIVHIF